jgi:hypothetical protein
VRAHWLKAIGHARGPAPADWLEAGWQRTLRRTGFARRPRIAPGDRLVYYAPVWQRVFALMEVTGEPTDAEPPSPRWPWTVAVAPLLVIPSLDDAPPVQALGIPPRSMSQHSHIRLTEDQYSRAWEAIASIGR